MIILKECQESKRLLDLKYDDLYTAYTETVVPVTLEDYENTKKFKNVDDYKKYILEYYTFLKRPVILLNNQIFIGNSKKTVEAAKLAIHE